MRSIEDPKWRRAAWLLTVEPRSTDWRCSHRTHYIHCVCLELSMQQLATSKPIASRIGICTHHVVVWWVWWWTAKRRIIPFNFIRAHSSECTRACVLLNIDAAAISCVECLLHQVKLDDVNPMETFLYVSQFDRWVPTLYNPLQFINWPCTYPNFYKKK